MTDTTTLTDWRSIDTATNEGRRALDVEIARRLGYRFERPPWMDEAHTYVYYPSGDQMYQEMPGYRPIRMTPVFEVDNIPYLPKYTSDLNAAASLPYTDDYWLQVSLSPDGDAIAYARVLHNYSSGHGAIRGQDKSEAVARCKAWLAWQDSLTK